MKKTVKSVQKACAVDANLPWQFPCWQKKKVSWTVISLARIGWKISCSCAALQQALPPPPPHRLKKRREARYRSDYLAVTDCTYFSGVSGGRGNSSLLETVIPTKAIRLFRWRNGRIFFNIRFGYRASNSGDFAPMWRFWHVVKSNTK